MSAKKSGNRKVSGRGESSYGGGLCGTGAAERSGEQWPLTALLLYQSEPFVIGETSSLGGTDISLLPLRCKWSTWALWNFVMSDSATALTVTHQDSLSMGFSRQEYWSGLPFPTPGDLPDPGIKTVSSALKVDSLSISHLGSPESYSSYIFIVLGNLHIVLKRLHQLTFLAGIHKFSFFSTCLTILNYFSFLS